jgi:Holliday junction DNA helicase RuvA
VIARLRGLLVERGEDYAIVECMGVGYDVGVSLYTLAQLPEPGEGSEVTLRVYTAASENKVALFGFATAEEREMFDKLITVKNVGPSTAVAILSGASSPVQLARTIAANDLAGLTRIKGVGKKTAELLVVELREKCEFMLATWTAAGHVEASASPASTSASPSSRRGSRSPVLDDVASALVGLGWRAAEVDKVVARLDVVAGATVETLLREALRAMPRP